MELLQIQIGLHAAAAVIFAVMLLATASTSIRKPSFARQVLLLLGLWPAGLCATELAPGVRELAVAGINSIAGFDWLAAPSAETIDLSRLMYALSLCAAVVRIAGFAFFGYRIPKGTMNPWRGRERTFGIALSLGAYSFAYLVVVFTSYEAAGALIAITIGALAVVMTFVGLLRMDTYAAERRMQASFF